MSANETDGNESTDWDTLGFILASDHRKGVIDRLRQGPTTPGAITDHLDIEATHVSRTLTELQNRGLAELMNPDARKGRIYRLTEEGQEIAEEVGDMDVSDGGSDE